MSTNPTATDPRVQFNLATVFETLVETLGDRECFVWRDRRLSYAQLADRSRRLAAYLHGQGLGVRVPREAVAGHESGQDHVALALYNGNEYLEGMLGAFGARLAPFNVNYRYVGDELRYLLNDARPARARPPRHPGADPRRSAADSRRSARGPAPGGRRVGE